MLVVEQELGQRLGQLGLADAGRPEEHERADRTVRILQAGARAPHRGRHRLDGFGLADDTRADLLLHLQQLLALAFEHAVDRNAGPARHHLRDVARRHRFLDDGALRGLLLDRFQLALEVGNAAVGKFAGTLVVAVALGSRRARCGPGQARP